MENEAQRKVPRRPVICDACSQDHIGDCPPKKEMVNHPAHYGGDEPYEVIKVLDAWGFTEHFCLGNTIKYIVRAERKGSKLEDLKKARWYLDYAINHLVKQQEETT